MPVPAISLCSMMHKGAPCKNFPTSANLNGAASTSVSTSVNSNVGPLSPAKTVPTAAGGEPEMAQQLQQTFFLGGSASESRKAVAETVRLTELTEVDRVNSVNNSCCLSPSAGGGVSGMSRVADSDRTGGCALSRRGQWWCSASEMATDDGEMVARSSAVGGMGDFKDLFKGLMKTGEPSLASAIIKLCNDGKSTEKPSGGRRESPSSTVLETRKCLGGKLLLIKASRSVNGPAVNSPENGRIFREKATAIRTRFRRDFCNSGWSVWRRPTAVQCEICLVVTVLQRRIRWWCAYEATRRPKFPATGRRRCRGGGEGGLAVCGGGEAERVVV
ncbi:UNVERIFIED_CONTAM: hypothetical protein Sindi_2706200 [Sesamum indicum]